MQAIGLTRPGLSRIGAPAGLSLVPGAVAYWDMTQVQGQIIPDLSGNGNHATLGSTEGADTNDPTWGGNGGLVFDGSDNYATCGTSAPLGTSGTFTVQVVSQSAAAHPGAIISRMSGTGDDNTGVVILYTNTSISAYAYGDDRVSNHTGIISHAGYGVPDIITVTLDGSSLKIATTRTSKSVAMTGFLPASAQELVFGRYSHTPAVWLNGTIHAVVIYPYVLSPSQIAQNCGFFKTLLTRRGVAMP